MQSIKLSIITFLSLTIFSYAGGDILPDSTIYEQEDINLAQDAATVEPVVPQTVIEPIKEQKVVKKEPKKEIIPSGFYAGLGITGSRYTMNCNCATKSDTDNSIGMVARVGYDFNQYIGIEARGIKTVLKDDGASVTHSGIFLKPMYPVKDNMNLYALIGVAKTKTKGTLLQQVDAEGTALGAGVELDLSKDIPKEGRYSRKFDGKGDQEKGLGLFLDYERLIVDNNSPDLDTVSAGVTYDF